MGAFRFSTTLCLDKRLVVEKNGRTFEPRVYLVYMVEVLLTDC